MAATYASEALGIESLPAAIVFVILYVPLLVLYLSKTIRRPIYVYIILTLFCSLRVTAFVLRAVLSRVESDANNVHVIVAYEIIYNTGFFGLLYSTYTLLADRVALAKNPPDDPLSRFILRLVRLRVLFRLLLLAAVAIGITGAIDSSLGTTPSTLSTGTTLRRTAIYIFLVCSILVLILTAFLARIEFSEGSYRSSSRKIGSTYGVYILFVISLLLVVREAFFTATATNPTEQDKEQIWYPLSVVTEYIAVVLFAVPGLVPDAFNES